MKISSAGSNKELVIKVLREFFIDRNTSNLETYFSKGYIQHNPQIPNGSEAIPPMVKALPEGFKYEIGMVVAERDLVMAHGRYTGWGAKPLVAVDIFRIADGKLVEHWDVMQEEVPASSTASGNAMFAA